MISHGQAASNGYSKNFKRGRTRDTRNGRRKGSSEIGYKLQLTTEWE